MFPFDNLNLTIDSIYKQLLDKLRRDGRIESISKEFLSIPETYKRVFFVYRLLKTQRLIPLLVKEEKCEYSSIHYRNLGNVLYSRGDLHMAWQYYNLALMYSPLHAQSYSIAVANRSAALAGMKKYIECLEDIKMVFTLEYPTNIRDKLLKRKKMCEDALNKGEDSSLVDENEHVENILEFKGINHDKYIAASKKLAVMNNKDMGRHIVAKEDIAVGEVIVQEDPYVKVLLKSQLLIACSHCFSRNYNLYPCPYCCMTMYCSRPCVEQAWEQYHSYECPLIASIVKAEFTKLEWLALRTTIKARQDYSSWRKALRAVEEAESFNNTDDFGCLLTGIDDMVYSSKFYNSVHSLATNVEKRNVSDIFQKAVSAAVLMHYLAVANFVQTEDADLKLKIKKFTAEMLMRHLMTAPTNMHGITATSQNGEGNYVGEYNIGSGAYPFLSLINHSCSPNVVRYSRLGSTQMTLIALRPIKKGMQIFDNYGAHHAIQRREDRQITLRNQYKFTCVCEACIGDWPLYEGMTRAETTSPIASKVEELLNDDVVTALQEADRKRALKIYKPLCELATALEPYTPCMEVAECQETLKQCLAIFSGTIPFESTRFIEFEIPAPKVPGSTASSRFYAGVGADTLLDKMD